MKTNPLLAFARETATPRTLEQQRNDVLNRNIEQYRAARSPRTVRRRLLGLLALSSVICGGVSQAASENDVFMLRQVVNPGEPPNIGWQSTESHNYIGVFSMERHDYVDKVPAESKSGSNKVWNATNLGTYRFDLFHEGKGAKPIAKSDILTVTQEKLYDLQLDSKDVKTYEPVKVRWTAPRDATFRLKLGKGPQVDNNVPNLVVHAKEDGKPVGKGNVYTGIASLTTDEAGELSLVLEDRFEKRQATVGVRVEQGGVNTFAVSIPNKEKQYRLGTSLKVKWTAPKGFQGYLSLGPDHSNDIYENKFISGTSGETELRLSRVGTLEVRIGYHGGVHGHSQQIKTFAKTGGVVVQ